LIASAAANRRPPGSSAGQAVAEKGAGIETAGAARASMSAFGGVLICWALICPQARAADSLPPRLYEVTTETMMPHLEENLRYATTRQNRCLSGQDLASAFPILSHASLTGCRLEEENRSDQAVSYLLVCDGGHGTTGTAEWRLDAHRITGTLHVRLGGKNMTFYQRITATALGACSPEAK
jgi:hypothetical protein